MFVAAALIRIIYPLPYRTSCVGYDASTKRYAKSVCGLTEVPSDMPAQTEVVYLPANRIENIPDGAFSHLARCTYLDLSMNGLTELRPETFSGLSSLKELYLRVNRLTELRPETFTGLSSLEVLDLYQNNIGSIASRTFAGLIELRTLLLFINGLRTVEEDWFYPGFNFTNLILSHNPLQCDRRMCWIKQAERDGRITWPTDYMGEVYKPECENYPSVDWDDVDLSCPAPGESYS